jgi:molybdenum cofactor cytidylyltransferase
MGYPKPLLRIGNTSYLAQCAARMLPVTERLIIALGAYADRVLTAVPDNAKIVSVKNPGWQRGQLSSLKAGMREAAPECCAIVVHLVDHPMVRPETFMSLVAVYERTRAPIVIARYRGRRGHPVLFDRSIFPELIAASEDQGARVIVNANPDRVTYLDVDDPGTVTDLDTPSDLGLAGLPLPEKP